MKNATNTYTYDEQIVSDLYKDANGCRPSKWFWQNWNEAGRVRKQVIWDQLILDLEFEQAQRAYETEMHIEAFEKRVAEVMEIGAQGWANANFGLRSARVIALRWLADAAGLSETDYPIYEELEWHYGLPFGYVTKSLA
jgi:hypothetical protein